MLRKVEHILGSGNGTLDFAVEGEDQYYTWNGTEDADWTITDAETLKNVDEDRIIVYPEGDYFICEITATQEEFNTGPVRCFSE